MAQPTTALVIGGSMAGMFAARILSDHFDQVTVIERDSFPAGPEFRSGVPQGRHVHALLAQGQRIMEQLFPGLDQDFEQVGAPHIEWGTDTAFLTAGGWVKRFHTGFRTNLISRLALEHLIRQRLAARTNISYLTDHEVVTLTANDDKRTVTGVEVESRRDHTRRTLSADLVLDAGGRTSKMPEWLRTLGYEPPPESTVYAYIGYATRWYEAPTPRPDWKMLFINARPEQGIMRGGVISEVEGGRWVAMVGGLNRDYPPTEEAAFLEFARSLATPAMYEALKDARPISPVYGYRYDGNRMRHFEKMTRRPERFLVMGDAVCGFNPLYGQGMTVSGLEALVLERLLESRGKPVLNGNALDGLAEAYHQAVAKTLRVPWLMATGEDLRYPGTDGPRPDAPTRLVQRYMDRVLKAMPDDETLSLAFIETSNLTRPPTRLFTPGLAARVLWRTLRGKSASATDMLTVPPRPLD